MDVEEEFPPLPPLPPIENDAQWAVAARLLVAMDAFAGVEQPYRVACACGHPSTSHERAVRGCWACGCARLRPVRPLP